MIGTSLVLLLQAALANPLPSDEGKGCKCRDDKDSPSAISPASWAASTAGLALVLGFSRRPPRPEDADPARRPGARGER